MKRLVGGLVLLSLMSISLDVTAGETDITDKEVLDQLVNLRGFIDEQRDFTKASKGLKPVLVQYRSSALKIDGIVQCNLSFDTDALHLSIGGCSLQADGTTISILIKVVYEWTEYVGYTIKSATLTCSDIEVKKVKVADVKNIDGEILSQLKCGDVVIKEDASGEHAYIVTYRGETGICLTYADASVIETQSYDLVDGEWEYNSEDKSGNLIEDVKPIYYHPISIYGGSAWGMISMIIIDNNPNAYTKETLLAKIADFDRISPMSGCVRNQTLEKDLVCAYAYKYDGKHYILGTYLDGAKETGYNVQLEEIINRDIVSISDGVNKIN